MQSFDVFLTELWMQAKKCGYGTLTDELIRNRLVLGIQSMQLACLWTWLDPSKMHWVADDTEIAQTQMQAIKQIEQTQYMNSGQKLQTSRKAKEDQLRLKRTKKAQLSRLPNCKYCSTSHMLHKESCPTFGSSSYPSCGKANHFAKVCLSTRQVHTANIGNKHWQPFITQGTIQMFWFPPVKIWQFMRTCIWVRSQSCQFHSWMWSWSHFLRLNNK